MSYKILFVSRQRDLTRMFWNDDAAKFAAKNGITVDIPAYENNLPPTFDWSAALSQYNGILTTWDSPEITTGLLGALPRCRFLGHVGGSVAIVAHPSIFECGVRVTTANGIMAEAVAEWSLLATLMAARNPVAYMKIGAQRRIGWHECGTMRDLKRMTVGIWGMGDTTRHLLAMLAPLRPGRILVASRHSTSQEIAALGGEKTELETLLRESDMVHLLVGVNPENLFRIGAPELAMMKNGAILINGGRARLTQEEPLLQELKRGRIGAILDVFHTEPLPEDSPLLALDNVICTPHNAGYTGRERFVPFLLGEFMRLQRNEPLQGEVSRSRRDTMTDERLGRAI